MERFEGIHKAELEHYVLLNDTELLAIKTCLQNSLESIKIKQAGFTAGSECIS